MPVAFEGRGAREPGPAEPRLAGQTSSDESLPTSEFPERASGRRRCGRGAWRGRRRLYDGCLRWLALRRGGIAMRPPSHQGNDSRDDEHLFHASLHRNGRAATPIAQSAARIDQCVHPTKEVLPRMRRPRGTAAATRRPIAVSGQPAVAFSIRSSLRSRSGCAWQIPEGGFSCRRRWRLRRPVPRMRASSSISTRPGRR